MRKFIILKDDQTLQTSDDEKKKTIDAIFNSLQG